MANDIQASISGIAVKNGTSVVLVSVTGTQTIDTYVKNYPTISSIENKYDTKFDDPRYYTGDTAN